MCVGGDKKLFLQLLLVVGSHLRITCYVLGFVQARVCCARLWHAAALLRPRWNHVQSSSRLRVPSMRVVDAPAPGSGNCVPRNDSPGGVQQRMRPRPVSHLQQCPLRLLARALAVSVALHWQLSMCSVRHSMHKQVSQTTPPPRLRAGSLRLLR